MVPPERAGWQARHRGLHIGCGAFLNWWKRSLFLLARVMGQHRLDPGTGSYPFLIPRYHPRMPDPNDKLYARRSPPKS
jgi:hypothetical protein